MSRVFFGCVPEETCEGLAEFLGAFLKRRAIVSCIFGGHIPQGTRECLANFLGPSVNKCASGSQNFLSRS